MASPLPDMKVLPGKAPGGAGAEPEQAQSGPLQGWRRGGAGRARRNAPRLLPYLRRAAPRALGPAFHGGGDQGHGPEHGSVGDGGLHLELGLGSGPEHGLVKDGSLQGLRHLGLDGGLEAGLAPPKEPRRFQGGPPIGEHVVVHLIRVRGRVRKW